MLYRAFLILLLIQQGSGALETQNSTTLYNSEGSISCTSAETISWLKNDNAISDNDDYSIAVVASTSSTLTITSVTETTTFTCRDSSGDLPVTIHVANIAGISSPLCKERCEVSCTLDLLRKDVSTTVQWSGTDGVGVFYLEEDATITINDGTTILKHRSDEFSFTSQQTFLTIKNLPETSHFTCMYTLTEEDVTLQYTVSALIRNTHECDEYECTTQDKCHSLDIFTSGDCRAQCTECFKYNYILGDFIDNSQGQCKEDKQWCQAILDNKVNCNIKNDPVVNYCKECGYCLDLEFSASKMILPAIILLMLCLLTLLMCYKSYDEKRSVLPKVHITNADPGKIKVFPFKRPGDQTIIPNRLTESKQYLTPSSAGSREKLRTEAARENDDSELIHVLELRDSGIAEALACDGDSAHFYAEQKLNFGSEDDVRVQRDVTSCARDVRSGARDGATDRDDGPSDNHLGIRKEASDVSTTDVNVDECDAHSTT